MSKNLYLAGSLDPKMVIGKNVLYDFRRLVELVETGCESRGANCGG